MERTKVAVVGVGYLGSVHADKYAQIPEAELVGLVDIDTKRCREVAARTRCQPFSDYRDLLDRVEAVSIVVPTTSHYQIVKEFLLAGIDVLVEKPISSTLQEARELNTLAREKEAVFQVGHMERFNGALEVMNGFVHNPLLIESHRHSPFTGRGIDADVVADLMIHDIDIILNVVHSEIKEIEAVGISLVSSHNDIAHARISFGDGCVAIISANRVAQERIRTMSILQSDAYLMVDYLNQSLVVTRRKGEGPQGAVTEEMVRKNDSLEIELRAFLRCVRERTTPVVSGEDGQKALEVALQIIDSIDTSTKRRR